MILSSGTAKPFYRKPAGFSLLGIGGAIAIFLVWKLAFAEDLKSLVYTTEPVTRDDIQNVVTATGTLQPRDYVDVGAQVSGQLKKLHVEVGNDVKAGDLLAEIDATVYAAKVDATRAQLHNQKAQLLDREAQLALAQIHFKREKNLFAEDATTSESLETADANLKSARAQLKALQAQIQQTESTLRVESANLNYAKIYAPMDGTVVSITSRQGQTLNTNQMAPTIMRVADLSVMTVQTQVSEADIGKLRKGMEVYFTTLGSQGRRWYSKLDRIQPTPEILNNVVLYNALFDVPNEQRMLMTQMSTQVFFIEAQAKGVLLVPMSAVTFVPAVNSMPGAGAAHPRGVQQGEQKNIPQHPRPALVKVMVEGDVIEERKVLVGVTNRVQAEIIEGLKEGEKVVSGSVHPNQTAKTAPAGWGPPMGRR